jgi:hypothetical protein
VRDHGRLPVPQGRSLPERTVRRGAQIAVSVTRRTITHARPPEAPRLQRLAGPLVIIPFSVLMFLLAAILFVVLLIVVGLVVAALAGLSFVVRRRLPRPS